MSARVFDLTATRQQIREHQSLRSLATSILRLVELCPESPAEDPAGRVQLERWRHQLERTLDRLDRELRAHFAHEETSPMYHLAEEFAPHHDEIRRLAAEHRGMLEALDTLRAEASPKLASRLVDDTIRFVATLRAHEDAENTILEATYGEELAGATRFTPE